MSVQTTNCNRLGLIAYTIHNLKPFTFNYYSSYLLLETDKIKRHLSSFIVLNSTVNVNNFICTCKIHQKALIFK